MSSSAQDPWALLSAIVANAAKENAAAPEGVAREAVEAMPCTTMSLGSPHRTKIPRSEGAVPLNRIHDQQAQDQPHIKAPANVSRDLTLTPTPSVTELNPFENLKDSPGEEDEPPGFNRAAASEALKKQAEKARAARNKLTVPDNNESSPPDRRRGGKSTDAAKVKTSLPRKGKPADPKKQAGHQVHNNPENSTENLRIESQRQRNKGNRASDPTEAIDLTDDVPGKADFQSVDIYDNESTVSSPSRSCTSRTRPPAAILSDAREFHSRVPGRSTNPQPKPPVKPPPREKRSSATRTPAKHHPAVRRSQRVANALAHQSLEGVGSTPKHTELIAFSQTPKDGELPSERARQIPPRSQVSKEPYDRQDEETPMLSDGNSSFTHDLDQLPEPTTPSMDNAHSSVLTRLSQNTPSGTPSPIQNLRHSSLSPLSRLNSSWQPPVFNTPASGRQPGMSYQEAKDDAMKKLIVDVENTAVKVIRKVMEEEIHPLRTDVRYAIAMLEGLCAEFDIPLPIQER